MICLHCGYCCTNMLVVIVDNPELGIVEGNLKANEDNTRCQHLTSDNMCAVHDYEWYKETPCYAHGQIERGNTNCRMGEYLLQKKQNEKVID